MSSWVCHRLVTLSISRLPTHVLLLALPVNSNGEKGQEELCRVKLQGEWVHCCPQHPGHVFHLLLAPDHAFNSNSSYGEIVTVSSLVRPVKAVIITYPDVLVSATHIAEASPCIRRPVISAVYPMANLRSRDSLKGVLCHELFQEALRLSSIRTLKDLETKIPEICRKHAVEMFAVAMKDGEAQAFLKASCPKIFKWIGHHFSSVSAKEKENVTGDSFDQNFKPTKKKDLILNVLDIEQCVWSPQLGIKGKIDALVQISGDDGKEMIVPLELKTGLKAYFGHNMQVFIYSMLKDFEGRNLVAGLLQYLHEENPRVIKKEQALLISLLVVRNQIANSIQSHESDDNLPEMMTLPPLLEDKRVCSSCYQRQVCSFLAQTDSKTSSKLHPFHLSSEFSDSFKRYFNLWDSTIFEEGSFSNEKRGRLWRMDAKKRESSGLCVSGLSILQTHRDVDGRKFHVQLGKDEPFPECTTISEGTSVIVHIDEAHDKSTSFVFCYATVSVFDHVTRRVELFSSEEFPTELTKKGTRVSIDDDDGDKNRLKSMRSNLLQLLLSDKNRRLSELIIDLLPPKFTFDDSLEKNLVSLPVDLRRGFECLNLDQQMMIMRGLQAQDYLLVQGMPGSGKSTAIAVFALILAHLGKRVLLSAHTNSAVDNMLGKCSSYEIPTVSLIRLGNRRGISTQVREDNHVIKLVSGSVPSARYLEELFSKPFIMGATCLGISSSSFGSLFEQGRILFDYCIIDEATQIPEPVILSPLLCSRIFLLVGDSYQLSALSSKKLEVFETSLFERLSQCSHVAESSVRLCYQYRMNTQLQELANELIYSGQLKCLSIDVALQTIPSVDEDVREEWLIPVLSSRISLCLVDAKGGQEEKNSSSFCNQLEAQMILTILRTFIKCDNISIGVISPYKGQVELLRKLIRSDSSLSSQEVNTVDQFQGRDKDIILLSMVRTSKTGELLKDWRRVNVLLTRAKRKLVVVMNHQAMMDSPIMRSLITCESRLKHRLEAL